MTVIIIIITVIIIVPVVLIVIHAVAISLKRTRRGPISRADFVGRGPDSKATSQERCHGRSHSASFMVAHAWAQRAQHEMLPRHGQDGHIGQTWTISFGSM